MEVKLVFQWSFRLLLFVEWDFI